MGIVRYIVNDIDQALPFYEALGFELTERCHDGAGGSIALVEWTGEFSIECIAGWIATGVRGMEPAGNWNRRD
jgi:catechol 2,3-dioxygenase-like lactoylglutathione lyase family enzyme